MGESEEARERSDMIKKPLMCDPALFELDLNGKIFVVTGANAGCGYATACQLAKQGGTVIMACRNLEAAKVAAEQMIAEGALADRLVTMHLDLGEFASIRRFVEQFKAKYARLDALINNAGIPGHQFERQETVDGFEQTIGVNYYGHFYLTHLLTDVLVASGGARIVNVASSAHDTHNGARGLIDFDDIHFAHKRRYSRAAAYSQSKLANILHAKALAKHLRGSGVTAVSLHPGFVATDIVSKATSSAVLNTVAGGAMALANPVLRYFMGRLTLWEGAQTTLHCVLAPDVPEKSGQFFSQTSPGEFREREANKGGWPLHSPNPEVHEEENVDRLWRETCAVIEAYERAHGS
jgi:NAD(P)-dependent dehydrogenase (short-subunit alcohol dehydrogenase family)